jgi:hypothetical protein
VVVAAAYRKIWDLLAFAPAVRINISLACHVGKREGELFVFAIFEATRIFDFLALVAPA